MREPERPPSTGASGAERHATPDWTIRSKSQHQGNRTGRPKPRTGTPRDEATGPGAEHRGLRKVKEEGAAARTRHQGKNGHQVRTNKHKIHPGRQDQEERPGQPRWERR